MACRRRIPVWMRWPRFWAVVFVILAIVVVSTYNLTASETSVRIATRASVVDLAETYAGEIRRQIRTSVSSVHALHAMIQIDEGGIIMDNFDSLAATLISTYGGITNLQLAPLGNLQHIYPLVDETQDNRPALGLNLLLDPFMSPAAIQAILQRKTVVVGPLKLLQGGIAIIARRPIFTSFAPAVLPDAWFVKDGVNYTRNCSNPEEQYCSFPGPSQDGTPTFFWGFATMIGRVQELIAPVELHQLELGTERVAGINNFAYELADRRPQAPSDFYAQSSQTESLARAVEVDVDVEEAGITWRLKVAPLNGWPTVSSDFWLRVLVILPVTALLGVGLGLNMIMAMRRKAQQLAKLEDYRHEVISKTILASVTNMNLLQFPMCLLGLQDFLSLGQLISYEKAREAHKLRCIDLTEDAARTCRLEGVAFLSHQWAGFDHPDPEGIQYRTMVKSVQEVVARGIQCSWIWVDYCSIPQGNACQQQTAINSLSVYASYCSVFLSVVPPCKHADNGQDLDIHSYSSRAWCRLESLSYSTCSFDQDRRAAFVCTEDGISDDWEGMINTKSVLDVLGGAFSCCARSHPDGQPCDKQKIVGVMMAIYWRLLATCRDTPQRAERATELLQLVQKDESRYFPATTAYCSGSSCRDVELFDGFLPVLREMFLRDTATEREHRVVVAGVNESLKCLEKAQEDEIDLDFQSL